MRWRRLACVVVSIGALGALTGAQAPDEKDGAVRPGVFSWVDVYVDSGDTGLAAYQFELTAAAGAFRIVGVEGGEHPAFAEPPFYDPAALANERIILAAYDTGADLPTGPTRVARVHVQELGELTVVYEVNLTVAASADGEEIAATVWVAEGGIR
jgi:hypothetical protein